MSQHVARACGLCRKEGGLQDSHLFPAALYKILRDPAHPNPNPVMVTSKHAGPTSRQISAPLLCWDCEQRFSRLGEQHVIGQCARRDHFPLRELVQKGTPVAEPGIPLETKVYEVGSLLGQHVEEYLYFAASIFWRASVRRWSTDWKEFSLGVQYQEQFRRYLLGESEWPRNALLGVHVSIDETVDFVLDPVAERKGSVHLDKFYIPGILFKLLVGATVQRDHSEERALNSPDGRFMWLSPFAHDSLYWGFRAMARAALRNPKTLRPGT